MSTSNSAVWCVPVMLCLLGCGGSPATFPAGGRVTYADGAPLDGGAVEFRSLESKPRVGARGVIQPDGTFRLTTYLPDDGAVPGNHQALVVPQRPPGDRWEELRSSGQIQTIHSKYQRFDSSGLEFTVTPNPEENDFQIVVERPE